MNTTLIRTDDSYRSIIAAPDDKTRQSLYRERLFQPWQTMMQTVSPPQGDTADEFAGARAWGWLLPEDLTETPPALEALLAADTWEAGASALAQAATRLAPFADRLPIDSVEGWLVLADPARSDPNMRGYTGGIDFFAPRFVVQVDTADDYSLPRLPGAMVHELHHLLRLRLFPWDMSQTSVGDYIIHEGMAESFAAALLGPEVVGYYVTEIDEAGLATAKSLISDGLTVTGFNEIRSYIFGDRLARQFGLPEFGMPDYGGYAIGYRVVQAFLARTGQTIEQATFLPAEQIIAESGFFEG